MKRLLFTTLSACVILSLPSLAAAQTATGTGTANSSSNSGAVAISGGSSSGARASGGNAQIIFNTPGQTNSTSRIRQSGSLKTTPNAIAPGLGSAGIETCYGPGVSGGVSVTGFGASFGAGQFDRDCNARLYSRTLFAMGYKAQAIQLLVNESPMVQSAFGLNNGGGNPVVYGRPAAVAPRYVSNGCQKWSGGSPGAGVCVY